MQRASDMVHLVTKTALVIILSVMALVVFLQVIFRYVLNLPLFWTEEFARYCLVWASLLGAAVAMKRGQHLAVTFCMDRLPPGARQVFSVVARLSVILILAVILLGGTQLVLVTRTQISPALRVPMSLPYLAVPVGAAIMLFHAVVSLFPSRSRQDADS